MALKNARSLSEGMCIAGHKFQTIYVFNWLVGCSLPREVIMLSQQG